ncbi:AfsR/SARP family transcriptional regulator [Streptomyces radicis]|uniref:SARP family transcriptional regulator n=1 Tax=Streptomyces radicis TaxID=1750517 RepID=A0A3A9W7M2_9ACTN|nr:BTAD domain-containing putative transcriptional regulator [Streptomyces radicis]RKN03516.1 SARP family transcriptional regulator [Streptomyces radicis]RKN20324.1 SARP family transcriptional regulator [Streptomyces radicis]
MEVAVLGPVTLAARGQRLALRSDKERIVVATLALEVGRPVALSTLIDRLWDGATELPARPRENAHSHVSRTRRALREAAREDGNPAAARTRFIRGHAHTYTLEMDPDQVDWHRFQRLAARAARLEGEGDDEGAADLFRSAESLWRGEALAGLPGLWPEQVRTSLAESRHQVTSARFAAELRLGRFAECLAELSALAARHPHDQRLAAHLMIAYYGCGRDAEALATYRAVRRTLHDDLGSEPGEHLARVHQLILNRTPVGRLLPRPPGRGPTRIPPRPAIARTPRNNLPRRIELVGRIRELHRLEAAGDGGRVVALESISGMPGVGKTSLAIHAAHKLGDRFPDAGLYVNLLGDGSDREPLTAGAALGDLLGLLGIPAEAIPRSTEERAVLWRAILADRCSVIVLDDAAGPDQVRPLLPDTSPSLLIITSRRRLTGLPGVRSFALDVMDPDDAAALFRASAGEERMRDADDPAELARVVELCGYLPLAVELVAGRFSTHTSWDLATLRHQLSRPSGRLAQIHDGFRAIANAFGLSYFALQADQQSAFRLLGLFPGDDFDPSAAAALTGLPLAETERLLDHLLHCNLVREQIPNRYDFHDLVGEYARTLATAEETEEAREAAILRLINFYLNAADLADRSLYPGRPRIALPSTSAASSSNDWNGWFQRERGNLLATEAFARAHLPPVWSALLGHVLAGFLDAEGRWIDAAAMRHHAVAHWEAAGDARALSLALLDLGATHANTGRYEEAAAAYRRALGIAQEIDEGGIQAEALRGLGVVDWHTGRLREALRLHESAIALHTERKNTRGQARCKNNVAIILSALHRYRESLEHFQQVSEYFAAVGDDRNLTKTLSNIGTLQQDRGRVDLARPPLERALALARASGASFDEVIVQANLASVLAASENAEEKDRALAMFEECLTAFRSFGDRKNTAHALLGIGALHHDRGAFDRAHETYLRAGETAQLIGATAEETRALIGAGKAQASLGNPSAAAQHLSAALAVARASQAHQEEREARELLAEVHHIARNSE